MEAQELSQNVYQYINARLKLKEARAEFFEAEKKLDEANAAMQAAWHACKGAKPGVYSFRGHGRTAVVIRTCEDYPELVEVVQ